MKKLLTLLLCSIVCFAFVGCNKDKEAKEEGSVSQKEAGDIAKADENKDAKDAKPAKKKEKKPSPITEEFLAIAREYCQWEINCKKPGMEGISVNSCVSAERMGKRCVPQRQEYYKCAVKTSCDDEETCRELSTKYGNCQVGRE